jgi:hypothetical protein
MTMNGPVSRKMNKPDFGQRGRAERVQHEPKPTSMEQLKKIAIQWWDKTVSGTRKTPKSARVGKRRG